MHSVGRNIYQAFTRGVRWPGYKRKHQHDVIELPWKRAFQHNIDGTRSRGDKWSLRAFASMPCTAIFLQARAEIKNFALRAASSLDRLNFASKSSKGKILRTVKNFHGPFITPRSKYKNKVFAKVYLQYHIC